MTTTGQSSSGWHRIAKFIECPQALAYRERLGLRPRLEPIEPARGTVLHEGLRHWYASERRDLDGAVATIRAMPERYSPATIEQATTLLLAYATAYRDEPLDVLATEIEVAVSLAGRPFTRRIDLIAQRRTDGHVWIYDHKTAGDVAKRARTADLDWSLMTQELVLASQCEAIFSAPYGGFVLNLIGTASFDTPLFRRQPIAFSRRMLQALPRSLHYYLGEIERTSALDPWEYPRSGSCVGRYRVCEYKPLCERGPAAVDSGFVSIYEDA